MVFNQFTDTIGLQQQGNGTFHEPPSGLTHPSDYSTNIVYQAGTTLNVSWVSNYDLVDVLVAQPAIDGTVVFNYIARNVSASSVPWLVAGSDFANSVPAIGLMFYMWVAESGSKSNFFTSHFFNVSTAASSSSAAGTARQTVLVTQTANHAGAGITSPPSSSTDASSGPPSNVGLIAGVSVASALAAGALAAAAVWFFCVSRRPKIRKVAAKPWADDRTEMRDGEVAHEMGGPEPRELGRGLPFEAEARPARQLGAHVRSRSSGSIVS